MRMKVQDCNKCKSPIFWSKSKKTGSNMMFDEATGSGPLNKWAVFEDGNDLKAEYVGGGSEELYSSHFDTCEAKDGSPHRAAAATRREAPQSTRQAAPAPRREAQAPAPRLAVARSAGDSVEVTVTIGDLIYSGTCTLVVSEPEKSDADDSPDADL